MSGLIGVTLDLEWDGNDPDQRLLVVGVNDKAFTPDDPVVWDIIASPYPKIVFSKADHRWLIQHGYKVGGPMIDVQAMCWTYDERTPLTLDWCTKTYLGYDPDKRLVRKGGVVYFRTNEDEVVPIGEAPIDQLLEYNERDLEATRALGNEMARRMQEVGVWDHWIGQQKNFTQVLLTMEMNGLPIDVEATRELQLELGNRVAEMDMGLHSAARLPGEFNLNSRDQLADYLFTKEFTLPARIRLDKETMAALREGVWPKEIPTTFDIQKLGRDYVHGVYELKGLGLKPTVKAPRCAEHKCKHAPGDCLPSVSAKTLKVKHESVPWVREFVAFKGYTKALQFLDLWLRVEQNGRLYTHFRQTGTETGRLSSADPVNLQNIPSRGDMGKRIRSLFKASEGNILVGGDFSQLEPRLMAHFSRDPVLVKNYVDGTDIYLVTAAGLFNVPYDEVTPKQRAVCKTLILALGYGAGPAKIRDTLAEDGWSFSLPRITELHSGLQDLYSQFWDWKELVIAEAMANGYTETLGGHRRHFEFGYGEKWKVERQAVNSIIQGSAADIVRSTMMLCSKSHTHWKMVSQVHDELLFEVPLDNLLKEDIHAFRWNAEFGHGYKLNVPLVFEPKVGMTWNDLK